MVGASIILINILRGMASLEGGIFSSIILSPTMKKWSYKRDGLSPPSREAIPLIRPLFHGRR
jgi:hypothetical protein